MGRRGWPSKVDAKVAGAGRRAIRIAEVCPGDRSIWVRKTLRPSKNSSFVSLAMQWQ